MSAAAAPVVRGTGLVKSFPRAAEIVHALRGADISVQPGEIVGVSGASGSGKSTMLAVLCGWEELDSGTVEHPAGAAADLPWSELAMLPQTLGLLEDLTVEENITLPARLARPSRDGRERGAELMQRLGLDHLATRYPSQVSIGEQQRTALARALLLRPGLLLADEPTAHQDHGWAAVALDIMRGHAHEGGAFILVSHDAQALDSCDRVLTMRDGTLT